MRRQTETVPWLVEFHEEFYIEFEQWTEQVQDALLIQTGKLKVLGPSLGRPSVDTLKGSITAI